MTRPLGALEVFPALAESRDRLLRLAGEERPSTGAMVNAVESDPALAISVLRMANRPSSARSGKVLSPREAVELLGPGTVETLAVRTAAIDFFERKQPWDVEPSASGCTRWPSSASPIGSRAR